MSFAERELYPLASMLRFIAATVLVLPVCFVMLAAGTVAIALTVAMWPFACIRNTANTILEGLLREILGRAR